MYTGVCCLTEGRRKTHSPGTRRTLTPPLVTARTSGFLLSTQRWCDYLHSAGVIRHRGQYAPERDTWVPLPYEARCYGRYHQPQSVIGKVPLNALELAFDRVSCRHKRSTAYGSRDCGKGRASPLFLGTCYYVCATTEPTLLRKISATLRLVVASVTPGSLGAFHLFGALGKNSRIGEAPERRSCRLPRGVGRRSRPCSGHTASVRISQSRVGRG